MERLEDRETPSVDVLSYRYDLSNTGHNAAETDLTPTNVTPATFGKLFIATLDGQVYGQPLYVQNVTITVGAEQGVHDVIYAVTQGNGLYALDAADGSILWSRSFVDPAHGITTIPAPGIIGSTDIVPQVGITSTPTIDLTSQTIYLISRTNEQRGGGDHYVQTIRAIDLGSGADKPNGAKVIADTLVTGPNFTNISGPFVYGSAPDGVDGKVYFNALRQNQRAALTLHDGTVWAAWASHGENEPEHGWIMGFSAADLSLTSVFCVTPNGVKGGIWQGGSQLSFDEQGYMYVATDGGTFDRTFDANGFPIHGNYANSILKLAVDPSTTVSSMGVNGWGLKVVDYFTPFNVDAIDAVHHDLSSGGTIVLPDDVGTLEHPHLLLTAHKEGRIYLLDRDNLGKFNPQGDQIVQFNLGAIPGVFGSMAYANNHFYAFPGYSNATGYQFAIDDATMGIQPTSRTSATFVFPGASPVVSSNGAADGIVWVTSRTTNELLAYDANNLGNLLYRSNAAPNSRDALGSVTKFAPVVVTGGLVIVGTGEGVVVYGKLPEIPNRPLAPTNLTAHLTGLSTAKFEWAAGDVNQQGYVLERSLDGVNFTQVGSVGAQATSLDLTGLYPSATFVFRVRAYNQYGQSDPSPTFLLTTATPGVLSFNQFSGASGSVLTGNGSVTVNGSALELTNGQYQKSSVFSASPVDITHFATEFLFRILPGTNPLADGFTFTIQGVGPHALGDLGAGLGYGSRDYLTGTTGGIPQSVAIKFDFNNNQGEGSNSTGLYLNGNAPTSPGSIDLNGAGIDLRSGNLFSVSMFYDGQSLSVTLRDTVTGAKHIASYAVDIPSVVGGVSAYVGFTAGTGFLSARQQVTSWWFASIPTTAPSAPAFLVAGVPDVNPPEAQLSWASVSGATSYLIERKTGSSGTYELVGITAGNAPDLTDRFNLSNGTSYTYRVRAVNAFGQGLASNEFTITTLAPPTTPSNLRATSVTNQSISLAWDDNSSNETGFLILRKVNNTGVFVEYASVAANTTTFTDLGLLAGTFYEYRVRAYNSTGYGDYIGLSVATIPNAPTGVSVTPGAGALLVSWSADPLATKYNIYRETTPQGGSSILYQTVNNPYFYDLDLPLGSLFYYRVSTVTAAGESSKSNEVGAAVTSIIVPPINFRATSATNSTIDLSWQLTIPEILGVEISRRALGSDAFEKIAYMGVGSTTYRDTGLSTASTYEYHLRQFTMSGISAPAQLVASTQGTYPAAPTNLVALATGATQVVLYWSDNASNESGNLILRRALPNGSYVLIGATGANGVSFIDTNVEAGVSYQYQVLAYNGIGYSGFATASATTFPAPPTNLQAVGAVRRVNLTWTTAQGATSYNIYRSLTGGSSDYTFVGASSTSSYSDLSLGNGVTAHYRVRSVGVAGEGALSATVVASTVALPTGPSGLSASGATASSIALTWTDMSSNEDAFLVFRRALSGSTFTLLTLLPANSASYVDSSVAAATEYEYRVMSINAAGVSLGWASVIAGSAPLAPIGLTAGAALPGAIPLSWSATTGATSYSLYRSTTSGGQGGAPYQVGLSGTTFIDQLVTPGVTYFYRLAALTPYATSALSAEVSRSAI